MDTTRTTATLRDRAKRLLGALVLCAAALTLALPARAMADPTAVATAEDLLAAVAAAPTDGTETVIDVSGTIGLTTALEIPAGANVRLQGDGTITVDSSITDSPSYASGDTSKMSLVKVADGATLTLGDGGATSLTLDGAGIVSGVVSEGTLTLQDGATLTNAGSSVHPVKDSDHVVTNTNVNWGHGNVVVSAGKFTMTGGTISNGRFYGLRATPASGKKPKYIAGSGGLTVRAGATATMSGGTITGNWSESTAGGVYVSGTFNMEGGTISNNTALQGGGVYLYGAASSVTCEGAGSMTMSGGSIVNNTATNAEYTEEEVRSSKGYGGGAHAQGGGIYADGYSAWKPSDSPGKVKSSTFVMTGGEISGNKAVGRYVYDADGGGIHNSTKDMKLIAGKIENNTSTHMGGGVYVGLPTNNVQFGKTLVTGNTASRLGGGIWCCPIGEFAVDARNTMAIYGNTADGAGADVAASRNSAYLEKHNLSEFGVMHLSQRMLGYGLANWHVDGDVDYTTTQGTASDFGDGGTGERYVLGANNTATWLTDDSSKDLAIAADPTEEAKAAAVEKAELVISGNSAMYGGGIGSDGTIESYEETDKITVSVEKAWDDDVIPDDVEVPEVTVHLWRQKGDDASTKVEVGSKTITYDSSSKTWSSATFEDLPRYDENDPTVDYRYTVTEDPVDGWQLESTVSSTGVNVDYVANKSGVITLTNKRIPGSVTVVKKDSNTGDVLTDPATFELYSTKKVDGAKTTTVGDVTYYLVDTKSTVDGKATFSDLSTNTGIKYVLVETEAPTGYVLDPDPIEVGSLPQGGKYEIELEAPNTPETGSITLHKLNPEREDLPGATFTLYSTKDNGGEKYEYNGTTYYEMTSAKTDSEGLVAFKDLEVDYTGGLRYLLVETEAPDGYKVVDPIEVGSLPVTAGGQTSKDVTYEAVDKYDATKLPATGGLGTTPLVAGGLATMAACLLGHEWRERRRGGAE